MDAEKNSKQICVRHVNVRMSIAFLVLKLIIADTISAFLVLFVYTALVPTGFINSSTAVNPLIPLTTFIILTLIESLLTTYIVLKWVSEYYEISAYTVSYKRGVIFKKEDRYGIQNIKQVQISQGVMGRLLNYGTLTLFDWRLNKTAEMYAVHNPHRYLKILDSLLPNVDEHKSTIRESIVEEDSE